MGVGELFKQGGKEPGLWLQRREEGSGEAGQERKQRAGLVRRAWPVRQAGTVRGHLSEGEVGVGMGAGWIPCQAWKPIGGHSSHTLQTDLTPHSLNEDRNSFPFLGILMTVLPAAA